MSTETSRRTLITGAGLAALPMLGTLQVKASNTVASYPVDDPIFAVIESHRRLYAEWLEVMHQHNDLEASLGPERAKSTSASIVETDDPAFLASMREYDAAIDATFDAAIELTKVQPTTLAGVIGLVRYAAQIDGAQDGAGAPEELYDDDPLLKNGTGSFSYFIQRNVAGALETIAAG